MLGFGWLMIAHAVALGVMSICALWVYGGVVRSRWRVRAARRASEKESLVLDVGDGIIHGRVELSASAAVAIVSTVHQSAYEQKNSSGEWVVEWIESSRSVDAQPFYVVHASGERVRVEPEGRVKLKVPLTLEKRTDLTHREESAILSAGDEVWVWGVLGKGADPEAVGGYRAASGWVMRPPPEHPLVIAHELPAPDWGTGYVLALVVFTAASGLLACGSTPFFGIPYDLAVVAVGVLMGLSRNVEASKEWYDGARVHKQQQGRLADLAQVSGESGERPS